MVPGPHLCPALAWLCCASRQLPSARSKIIQPTLYVLQNFRSPLAGPEGCAHHSLGKSDRASQWLCSSVGRELAWHAQFSQWQNSLGKSEQGFHYGQSSIMEVSCAVPRRLECSFRSKEQTLLRVTRIVSWLGPAFPKLLLEPCIDRFL